MTDVKTPSDEPDDDAAPAQPSSDRDQTAYSVERAHEKADKAEYPRTPGAPEEPDPDGSLVSRDNMQGPAGNKP